MVQEFSFSPGKFLPVVEVTFQVETPEALAFVCADSVSEDSAPDDSACNLVTESPSVQPPSMKPVKAELRTIREAFRQRSLLSYSDGSDDDVFRAVDLFTCPAFLYTCGSSLHEDAKSYGCLLDVHESSICPWCTRGPGPLTFKKVPVLPDTVFWDYAKLRDTVGKLCHADRLLRLRRLSGDGDYGQPILIPPGVFRSFGSYHRYLSRLSPDSSLKGLPLLMSVLD